MVSLTFLLTAHETCGFWSILRQNKRRFDPWRTLPVYAEMGGEEVKNSMRQARASLLCLALMGAGAPVLANAQVASEKPVAADSDPADAAIIVTGRRAALQAAEDRKKNASTIIDSVVADEAGKLPDNSITEVLQRVSGVAIVRFAALGDPDHFSVEGSGVQVRGLSGVASRLNGREVFGANGGRSLLWGDVTPELMAAVDVYKSSSADQIEGGTGGSIDLRTKMPFDFARGIHVSGSGTVSTGDLAKKTDYDISGLITGNWDTGIGRIGILLDGAYSLLHSRSHFIRMEPYFRTRIGAQDYFIPGGYDYGEDQYTRRRDGFYGALQWAPSDDLELKAYYFRSRYRNHTEAVGSFVTSQTLAVNPAESEFDSNGGLLFTPNLFQRDTGTFLPSGGSINAGGNTGASKGRSKTEEFSTSFEWTPGGGRLALHGGYDHITARSANDSGNLFRTFAWPSSLGLDLRGKFPKVTLPASFDKAELLDPANYTWQATMPHNEDNRGVMDAVNFDADLTFDDGFLKGIKVGGRWADRTERDLSNGYAWTALGAGWNGSPVVSFADTPDEIEVHEFDNFFHGKAPLPGVQLVQSIALTNKITDPEEFAKIFATYGGSPGRTPGFILPADRTDYRTETLAGYAMARFGTEWGESSLSGNAGVRVVRVKNSSSGFFKQNATTFIRNGQTFVMDEIAGPRTDGATFTRVLPAINLTYSPSEPVKIRAAYNITMDNAGFYALRASGGLGVASHDNPACAGVPNCNLPKIFDNYTTDSGNPRLKPAMSNNFDLAVEWYPRPGTSFHVSSFYKRITNLYVYSRTQQPVTVVFNDGTSEQAVANSTDALNSPKAAVVKGVEIGGRLFFDQLPGLLRGIGVEANYTYIDSKNPGDIYFDIDGVEHSDATLQGLSRHNYNVTLLYEHDPVSFRVAYSWRSRYLQSTNANGTNQTYNYFSAPGTSTQIRTALPTYGSAYGQLDAGIYVKLNDRISVNVQGTNLLRATQKTLMGGYPGGAIYTRSWFQSDRRVSAGVNVNF